MLLPIRYQMWFDTDDKGGGGSDEGTKTVEKPKPADSGSQTDYQRMYTELSQKITNGEYVTQESYAAQQAKYQKLFDSHQELTKTHETLQGQLSELQVNLDKANADLETASTTTTEKETALTTAQNELGRLQLLMKDFPQLIPFEVEDGGSLLPQVDLEQLPSALEKFASKLSDLEVKKTADDLKGSTKKPAGKEDLTQRTAEIAKKEMNAAMGRGDIQEYEAKRAEYFELLGVEEAKPGEMIPE